VAIRASSRSELDEGTQLSLIAGWGTHAVEPSTRAGLRDIRTCNISRDVTKRASNAQGNLGESVLPAKKAAGGRGRVGDRRRQFSAIAEAARPLRRRVGRLPVVKVSAPGVTSRIVPTLE
jgi:hypothetical protein